MALDAKPNVTSGLPPRPRPGLPAEPEEPPGEATEPLPPIGPFGEDGADHAPDAPVRGEARPRTQPVTRWDSRELRDSTRAVRKGVKVMLARLPLVPVGPTPTEAEDIVRQEKAHQP